MISLRHVDRIYPLKGGPYYALRNISLDNAAYGNRVVRLQDGMLVK